MLLQSRPSGIDAGAARSLDFLISEVESALEGPDACDPEAALSLRRYLDEIARRRGGNRYFTLFPSEGRFARSAYPRSVEFFDAGRTHNQRCFMAGNRVGKTETGGFESVAHLTGEYFDWWPGHRFADPILGWVAGRKYRKTKDVIQKKLFGPTIRTPAKRHVVRGTGIVPLESICFETANFHKQVAGLMEEIQIRYKDSLHERSVLQLLSYEQGPGAFEGDEVHWVWDDEEPPEDVYAEQLLRIMTCDGRMILTFTPLDGHSAVVTGFLPGRYQVQKSISFEDDEF